MKQGLKRTISWNKYRSKTKAQLRENSLDYKIDLTFRNINRLFHLLLSAIANDNDDFPERNYFCKCYMRLIEIKRFNGLFDKKKTFFDQLVKTNKKCIKNLLMLQERMAIQKEA